MTREKVIKIMKLLRSVPSSDEDCEVNQALDIVIKMLEQQPKKGRWLAIRTKDDTHEITCSCCGYVRSELLNHHISEESLRRYLKDITAEYKYCCNCGAKMEGEIRE